MAVINIGKHIIGEGRPCFIIAEAGVNHILEKSDMDSLNLGSSLEVAYKLIDEAKSAGADAIKFQSFNANKLQYRGTKKPQYQINNVGDKISYFDLLKKLETSHSDQIKINDYCIRKDILFLSTPYDNENADFLDSVLKVPGFKLASIELNNHLFLDYIAQKNKPIILSSGLSTESDVSETFMFAEKYGFRQNIVLLHCNSDYPSPADDINLNVISDYKRKYPDNVIGFSDHSQSNVASLGAVALGAKILERHFTINRSFNGPDHSASLDSEGLHSWINEVREMEISMGSSKKILSTSEKKNLSMRKFLVINPINKGDKICKYHLSAMRTGDGVLPLDKNLDKIVGEKIKFKVDKKLPFSWDMINSNE